MIVATQTLGDGKQQRSRCVTVIPLRLELQRLLAAKLASMGKQPHSAAQFRISAASGLNTISELDEYLGSIPEQTPLAATPGMSRLETIQLTTDALCAASSACSNTASPKHCKPVVRGRCKSWQLPNATPFKRKAHYHRRRSLSCPGKLDTRRFKRAVPPIQPAVARYLSSANASRSPNTSPTKRGLLHMSAPYHRISLALLSRPAVNSGRHSLDNQPIRGNLLLMSPPTSSSLRRFASVAAKSTEAIK
ncbi:hypothetical protein GGI20_005836 [Coemansia sp. BCRC 34301]|nr:hypothetical protein GGI20_005836 [Coemansia sp. BCRC 34301]